MPGDAVRVPTRRISGGEKRARVVSPGSRTCRCSREALPFCMARGIGEDPARSPAWHVSQVEFPATREEIVATAEDGDAPVEVINFFKCLPRERYGAAEEVLRDFAEAERVFALGSGGDDRARREDLGRSAAGERERHP